MVEQPHRRCFKNTRNLTTFDNVFISLLHTWSATKAGNCLDKCQIKIFWRKKKLHIKMVVTICHVIFFAATHTHTHIHKMSHSLSHSILIQCCRVLWHIHQIIVKSIFGSYYSIEDSINNTKINIWKTREK